MSSHYILLCLYPFHFQPNPYAQHTAVALKELLKARGLKQSGKKTECIARLMDADAADADRAAAEAAADADAPVDVYELAAYEATTAITTAEAEAKATMSIAAYEETVSIEDGNTIMDSTEQPQQPQLIATSSDLLDPSQSTSLPPPSSSESALSEANNGEVDYRDCKISWLRNFCLSRSIPFDPKGD